MLGQRLLGNRIEAAGICIFLHLLIPLVVETMADPFVKTEKIFAWEFLNRGLDLLDGAHEGRIQGGRAWFKFRGRFAGAGQVLRLRSG